MNLLLDHLLQFNQSAGTQLDRQKKRIEVTFLDDDRAYAHIAEHPECSDKQITFSDEPETVINFDEKPF